MSVLSETMRSAIDSDISQIVNSGEFSEQITLFELIQIIHNKNELTVDKEPDGRYSSVTAGDQTFRYLRKEQDVVEIVKCRSHSRHRQRAR
jgi:hypothetical protein